MTALRELLQSLDDANRRYGLIYDGDAIVVALSGGPDSTALLALLAKWRQKRRLRLVAAHLDHGLQHDARRFFDRSERLCRELNVPLYSKRVDVRAFAVRERRSLEEAGRQARYEFFREVAAKAGCGKIATAHTEDDQAETILMRLMRGTGLTGLAGIAPKRREGDFEVIRPLIFCRKARILAFLKESRLPYCVDKSNKSLAHTRNRVRAHLLPALERFNPGVRQALLSFQAAALESLDFVEQAADRACRRCLRQRKGGVTLDVRALDRLHAAVARQVLIRAIQLAKGDARRISRDHVDALTALCEDGESGREAHLPGLTVRRQGRELRFDTRR